MNLDHNKKDIIILLIHDSIGEIRWILPFLKYIHDKELPFRFVTVLQTQNIKRQLVADKFHYSVLKEISELIPLSGLSNLLLKSRKEIKYIFRDFWPIKAGSLASRVYYLCPNAKLILYPHAYALYSSKAQLMPFKENKNRHDADCFDLFLANTPLDLFYWSSKIPHDRIIQTGPLGYSTWWLDQLVLFDQANKNWNSETKQQTILFAIRPPNGVYLTQENYDMLMRTALEALFSLENVHIIIKPHPRQKKADYITYVEKYPESKYSISFENPFVLAKQIDFAVNFYSSVSTDLLALKIPSIEYFVYEGSSTFWFEDGEFNKTSNFSHLGLVESISDPDTLYKRISELVHSKDKRKCLAESQYKAFKKVFGNVEDSGLFLVKTLDDYSSLESVNKGKKSTSIIHWSRVFLSSIKAKFKQILR